MPYPARMTVSFNGRRAMPKRGEKLFALRVDQVARVLAGIRPDAAGDHRRNRGEVVTGVKGREAIVLFRVGREVLIPQPDQQGKVRQGSPTILNEGIP